MTGSLTYVLVIFKKRFSFFLILFIYLQQVGLGQGCAGSGGESRKEHGAAGETMALPKFMLDREGQRKKLRSDECCLPSGFACLNRHNSLTQGAENTIRPELSPGRSLGCIPAEFGGIFIGFGGVCESRMWPASCKQHKAVKY